MQKFYNVQRQMAGVTITEDHSRMRDVVEVHIGNNVGQYIDEHLDRHSAALGVADTPLSSNSIASRILELLAGHVTGPLVHQPGRDDVATRRDDHRPR